MDSYRRRGSFLSDVSTMHDITSRPVPPLTRKRWQKLFARGIVERSQRWVICVCCSK